MDQREIRKLLRQGKTPRQVADILGGSRAEVTRLAAEGQRAIRKRVLIICLLSVVAGAALFAAYREFQDPDDGEVYRRILKAADALPKAPASGSWLMEQVPSSREAQISLIEEMMHRLNKALTDNADVPEVQEEAVLFGGHLVPTIFTHGITMWVGKDATPFLTDQQRLEVVFYSRGDFNHPRVGRRLFFYDPGWRAFFMAALKLSDETWYGAIIAHELWHAKRHREGATSATALSLSDLWVAEELEAHNVESKVLDARTKGAYRNQLRVIVTHRAARSIKKFLASVEASDIGELDRLFGNALPQEADTRVAHYYLDMGLLWLESRYAGEELRKKRISTYRYLVSPTSTNVQ